MQEIPFSLRFSLGRIPVVVEPTFWLMALLMGMNSHRLPDLLVWVGVVFASVLLHEMGHALAAQAMGSGSHVRLYSFGGLCYPGRRLSRGRRILLSLAGPGAGFVLGGLVYFLVTTFQPPLTYLGRLAVGDIMWVNIGWGVINLLPVLPLDGGHVLEDTLGPRHERTAVIVGVATSAVVVLLALWAGQIYAAVLFGWLGWNNIQRLQRR